MLELQHTLREYAEPAEKPPDATLITRGLPPLLLPMLLHFHDAMRMPAAIDRYIITMPGRILYIHAISPLRAFFTPLMPLPRAYISRCRLRRALIDVY